MGDTQVTQRGDILAVIGGQFGSEGKGVFVNAIAHRYQVHVRVGGPNAGHSFRHEGRVWKMQTIPCGWTNKDAHLIIGAGALLSVEQFAEEFAQIHRVDPSIEERIKIDYKAGMVSPWHHKKAGGVEGEAHKRYGSTGEGVGVARIARIERFEGKDGSGFFHAADLPLSMVPAALKPHWRKLVAERTNERIMALAAAGENVLLEGTQGAGLSLIHGPWPFVTNHDTNAAQFAADVGLPPRFVNRCLLVVRTFPIRVAGNSGPMGTELTWEEMSKRVGKAVTEQTTVTKKTRRIAEWNEPLVVDACTLNAPTSIAVSFLDYLAPEDEGVTKYHKLSDRSRAFLDYVRGITGAPVLLAGTGGKDAWNVVECPHQFWRL